MADTRLRDAERAWRSNLTDEGNYARLLSEHRRVGNFVIEDLPEGYMFWNLPHCRNADGSSNPHAKVNVLWSKALLDYGNERTQSKWVEWLKGKPWELADAQIAFSTMRALYLNQTGWQSELIKRVRVYLLGSVVGVGQGQYSATLGTRVFYRNSGWDVVVHRFGMDNAYVETGRFLRSDTGNIFNENCAQVLLGVADLGEIQRICGYIAGRDIPVAIISFTQRSLEREFEELERSVFFRIGRDPEEFFVSVIGADDRCGTIGIRWL